MTKGSEDVEGSSKSIVPIDTVVVEIKDLLPSSFSFSDAEFGKRLVAKVKDLTIGEDLGLPLRLPSCLLVFQMQLLWKDPLVSFTKYISRVFKVIFLNWFLNLGLLFWLVNMSCKSTLMLANVFLL